MGLGGLHGATIRVTSQAIIEVRPAALGQIRHHQETISKIPEQMYAPSETRLEWLEEGPLFKSDSNKRSFPGPLLKSGVGALGEIW